MAKVDLSGKVRASETRLLIALKKANGQKTVDEIAAMLQKGNGDAMKVGSVKTQISQLRARFKAAKQNFPVPLPKGSGQQGGQGRKSTAIGIDDMLAQLANVEPEVVADETAAE